MGHVVKVNGDYSIKAAESGTILLDTGDKRGFVRVTGSLIVDGDTLTVSAEDLNVSDNIITLNFGETGPGVTLQYSGIQIDRGFDSDSTQVPPAAFIFDENTESWIFAQGTPDSGFNFNNSSIKLRRIITDTDTDSGDLTLIDANSGILNLGSSDNYAQRLIERNDDNSIPNKKYVDDAILANPSFQIVRGNTRVTSFDISDKPPNDFFPIGPYEDEDFAQEDQVAIIIDNIRVARFTRTAFDLRGVSIIPGTPLGSDIFTPGGPTSVKITTKSEYTDNCDLILETAGTGKVQISYALQFDPISIPTIPAAINNTTVLYHGPVAAGTSGLYAVNSEYRDELVLKSRALLFSMIF